MLELQSDERQKRESDERQKSDKAQSRRDWLIATASLAIGGVAGIFGPALLRQERLGIAPVWTYENLAGTGGIPSPTAGQSWHPSTFLEQGAQAFREGTLLIGLSAEKDRNFTVMDVSVDVKDSAPDEEASWYFAAPPTAGGGPATNNLDLSYDLDSGAWVNMREPGRRFSNSKFDPFILAADSSATIAVWLKGRRRDYKYSVTVRYQVGGESKMDEKKVGDYAIYAGKGHIPAFTVNRDNVLMPVATGTLL